MINSTILPCSAKTVLVLGVWTDADYTLEMEQFQLRPALFDTVFFDVGSTLLELVSAWENIYHSVFQKAGYDLELGEVEQAVAYSWSIVSREDPTAFFEPSREGSLQWQREIEQRIMERLNIHPDVQEEVFWQLIKAFENPASYYLFPEVVPLLQQLKSSGYRLGIISNWSWHLDDLCKYHNIAQYFDKIIISARVGCSKPNPVIFQTALKEMEADPAHTIHIGDTYRADVLGAWSQGMSALWIDRRNEAARFEKKAALTPLQHSIRISSLDQILPFLEHGVDKLTPEQAIAQINGLERQQS